MHVPRAPPAQGYFYYIFGFCFVVGALTVLITVEVAIVCTYVQLCAEDYLWWCALPPHIIPHAALLEVEATVSGGLRFSF